MTLVRSPATVIAGRGLALIGVVLVALNLRTSVTSMSPIYGLINADMPLRVPIISTIGILPPAAFAVSGLLAPRVEARMGLEGSLIAALAVATVGHLLRAFAADLPMLIGGTALSLFGLGIGNVLLPPAVKRYFPARQGTVTSVYAAIIAISTAVPPLLAAPVAEASGWRVSLGMWAVLSAAAFVPWVRLIPVGRRSRSAEQPIGFGAPASLSRVWRAPITWALAAIFSVSAMNGYAMFAWLPTLLHDSAHVSSSTAGALLSLYAIMGLPLAVVIPAWTERARNPFWIMAVGIVATVVGNSGLLFAPTTVTWLWVGIAGLGPLLFPVCLTLINLRSRTERGSAALSGVSQGIGYVLGAAGPIVFGLLHDATHGWTAPMLFLSIVAVLGIGAALVAARPGYVDDSPIASPGDPRRSAASAPRHTAPYDRQKD